MPDALDLLREAVGSYEPRGDLLAVERRVERRRRSQRVSAGVVAFAVFAAAGWFALTVFRPGDGTPGSTPTPPAATIQMPNVVGTSQEEAVAGLEALGLEVSVTAERLPEVAAGVVGSQDPGAGVAVESGASVSIVVSEGTSLAEPVQVVGLPEVGVAVGSDDAVELVGLDGTIVATLPGYTLVGSPGAPGVWFRRGEQYFSLSIEERALIPVSASEAGGLIDDEGTPPALSAPPNTESEKDEPAGRWRYALESASGITLGQWAGACGEIAFWIDGAPAARIVTGEADPSIAPASLALGWTGLGEAIVLESAGGCGGTADPGIYLYSAPGAGRLVHPLGAGSVVADAWGAGL